MKAALKTIAIQVLPYPDPWHRWRMRRLARRLITCSRWPDEEATPTDIAQLALLRVLYLQREAHWSARVGGFESTMLLARATVDACISALYWLGQPEAGARLTKANAKSAKQMLKVFMDLLQVPTTALDEAVLLIGVPDNLPKLQAMASQVASQSGVPLTSVLHEHIYMPLSFLFEHTTGISLQRHIDRDGKLLDTPQQWWTRRRALHTVDLCAGYLAVVLAEHGGKDTRVLSAYVQAHAKRMLAPAVTMFLRFARQAMRVAELPKLARELVELRAASDTYKSFASDDERAAFAKDRIRHACDQLELFDDERLRDELIEILIGHLTRADVANSNG